MRRAAVLGRPIGHSLSPVLHRAAYAALELDWTYEAIDCGAEELPAVLAARPDWAGFSCTMPLKRALVEVADELGDYVRMIGAGNTLTPLGGGRWRAWATDVDGIVAALGERDVRPTSAVVLGAGGTAQNALAALKTIGLNQSDVLVRDPARTGELRASADRLGIAVQLSVLAPDAPALEADLIVATLPASGADALADRAWSAHQAVLDVVYDPWPTALAESFARAGATVVSGASMLLHQAAAQVELMTGRPAPVEAMRSALLAAAPGCGADA
jgi:shikimate dehydrogenase